MSDERLRRAARQLQAGDPQAAETLLRERLRAGTLDPERLRLAAFLGHAPARALDPAAPVPPDLARAWEEARSRGPAGAALAPRLVQRLATRRYLRAWCGTLAGLGHQPLVRCGHLGLSEAAAGLPEPPPAPVQRTLQAVEAWLLHPDQGHAGACMRLAEALSLGPDGLPLPLEPEDGQATLRLAVALLAYAVEAMVPASAADGVATALELGARALRLAAGVHPTPPPPDVPALPDALEALLGRAGAGLQEWALR